MAKTSPAQFLREVRQEVAKVMWPTRTETIATSIMVIIMAVIAAIFFFLADTLMARVVMWILGLGK